MECKHEKSYVATSVLLDGTETLYRKLECFKCDMDKFHRENGRRLVKIIEVCDVFREKVNRETIKRDQEKWSESANSFWDGRIKGVQEVIEAISEAIEANYEDPECRDTGASSGR